MNLRAIGCNVESAPVELREKLAFDAAKLARALAELPARYGAEAVVLGTCNRVELYLARTDTDAPVHSPLIAEFLAEIHGVPAGRIRPHLYEHPDADAVRHLFRVAAGLDSVVIGEAQIAGQVKEAYEAAQKAGATGPLLNVAVSGGDPRLEARPHRDGHRSRARLGIERRGRFPPSRCSTTFTDKTVLVIGAGEMGRLTLNHIRELNPARILVDQSQPGESRSARGRVRRRVVPWEQLDDALVQADIVLSTTGAPEPIVLAAAVRREGAAAPRRPASGGLRHGRAARLRPAASTTATASASSTWTT